MNFMHLRVMTADGESLGAAGASGEAAPLDLGILRRRRRPGGRHLRIHAMLRGLWALAVLVLSTAVCGTVAAVGSLLRPGSDLTMRMGRIWSRSNLAAVGARVRYANLERGLACQPCVYVCNHQSNVDIWALIRVLPVSARFVAKQSLFRIPAIGWALAASEFIPIDRSNRARAIRSLAHAASKIRAGRSVVLFPEGTRSGGDHLGPFKKGPFHLALRASVPVVPVAISGSGAVLPPRSMRPHPGPVDVRFLPPIDVSALRDSDVEGLRAEVRSRIEQALGAPVAQETDPLAAGAR